MYAYMQLYSKIYGLCFNYFSDNFNLLFKVFHFFLKEHHSALFIFYIISNKFIGTKSLTTFS